MERLRGGVILTDAFLGWLAGVVADEGPRHRGEALALHYVRCSEGPRAGQAWFEYGWTTRVGLPAHELFRLVGLEADLHLTRQTQRGLRHRCLDVRDGRVIVRGEG